jgi:hypothetical protein
MGQSKAGGTWLYLSALHSPRMAVTQVGTRSLVHEDRAPRTGHSRIASGYAAELCDRRPAREVARDEICGDRMKMDDGDDDQLLPDPVVVGLMGVEGPASGISESSACIVSVFEFEVDTIASVTWAAGKMATVDGAIRMGIESSIG